MSCCEGGGETEQRTRAVDEVKRRMTAESRYDWLKSLSGTTNNAGMKV